MACLKILSQYFTLMTKENQNLRIPSILADISNMKLMGITLHALLCVSNLNGPQCYSGHGNTEL